MTGTTQISTEISKDPEVSYLVRHVNFGSDDGSPASKFEHEFSCDNYIQARAIFDLIVSLTKYKPSRLILSYQHTAHLPEVSVSYMGDIYGLLGASPVHKDHKANAKGVLVDGLKGLPVIVHRGRARGVEGIATGYGYLAPIPTSVKRAFLFHKDESSIGPDTAIKYELMLEVLIGPDNKWFSGKYVEIPDSQVGKQPAIVSLLEGIIETLKQYVVNCPYCIQVGMSRRNDCFVEKLVTEMEVVSSCARCHRSFFVTLFE